MGALLLIIFRITQNAVYVYTHTAVICPLHTYGHCKLSSNLAWLETWLTGIALPEYNHKKNRQPNTHVSDQLDQNTLPTGMILVCLFEMGI